MELSVRKRMFPLRGGKGEVCGACGKAFECGAKLSECWCAEVKLTDAQREELKTRYEGCLCKKCLRRVAKRRS